MIALIGSILVWILIVIGCLGLGLCAVIGFMFLINFPTKFR